jgi:transposase-like protein
MSPRKLSDTDRAKILDLYRNSEQTTSTLATRYGVSSSTISRFLKNNLSESEYEDLIQEKRLARTSNLTPTLAPESQKKEESKDKKPELAEKKKKSAQKAQKQGHKSVGKQKEPKSSPKLNIVPEETLETEETQPKYSQDSQNLEMDKEIDKPKPKIVSTKVEKDDGDLEKENKPIIYLEEEEDLDSLNVLREMFGEDIGDDDDFEEDEDEDEDDWDEDEALPSKGISANDQVQILPLSQASFPHTCYLVVDRSAELITRPLRDFGDLGNIPSEEVLQKTLPVFDNHRVAKRFSHRRGKVIKVPDSSVLQKTSDHLYAKGITRLLIDGKIYSLS